MEIGIYNAINKAFFQKGMDELKWNLRDIINRFFEKDIGVWIIFGKILTATPQHYHKSNIPDEKSKLHIF